MKVKLKNVVASYPSVFKAEAFDPTKPNENRRTKCDFLIAKTNKEQIDIVNKAIIEGVKAAFGEKAAAMLKMFRADTKNFPFVDGDAVFKQKSGEPLAPGFFVLRSRRREEDGLPGVFDNKAGPDGKPAKLESNSGKIYGGAIVNASVDLWVQSGKYQGVRCNLLGIQYAAEGEAFGGSRPASADEFESLADETEMQSATTEEDFGLS